MKRSLIIESILDREIDPSFRRRAKIVFNCLNSTERVKILDVGCGRGFYLCALSKMFPSAELFGLDSDDEYLDVARNLLKREGVRLEKGDITKLTFDDSFFDVVIASEVLEHVDNDSRGIEQIHRTLKPGGRLIVTVPNKNYPFLWDPLNWLLEKSIGKHVPSNIWWLAGLWADHERLYSGDEIKEKLTKAGFIVQQIWFTTHYCFPFSHFLLYGIGKNILEKGLLKELNRFNRNTNRSLLMRMVQTPFYYIDKFNKDNMMSRSSVNIVVKAEKPKK